MGSIDLLACDIEALADARGMDFSDIVCAVATVAYNKADHLRVNWQAYAEARQYDKARNMLDDIYSEIANLGI